MSLCNTQRDCLERKGKELGAYALEIERLRELVLTSFREGAYTEVPFDGDRRRVLWTVDFSLSDSRKALYPDETS